MSSATETADLVRAASQGDSRAWEELVEQFTGLLWSIARGYDLDRAAAADVVQTAWFRLVEHLGRLERPERVGAWLATTVRRESLRVVKAGRREVAADDSAFEQPAGEGFSPEAATLAQEELRLVWAAFQDLPERCRRLLRALMASPPPAYTEVAAAFEIPVGSIGPTRGRCLDLLRRRLSGPDGGPLRAPA
ncbi:MAG TPA: sigma-70 family RNA polymerase sigma factor [Actinomycetes bacterium]|nr:sigma-70 family RNA polymerase sigma factor [Actinomycetes bacterium]